MKKISMTILCCVLCEIGGVMHAAALEQEYEMVAPGEAAGYQQPSWWQAYIPSWLAWASSPVVIGRAPTYAGIDISRRAPLIEALLARADNEVFPQQVSAEYRQNPVTFIVGLLREFEQTESPEGYPRLSVLRGALAQYIYEEIIQFNEWQAAGALNDASLGQWLANVDQLLRVLDESQFINLMSVAMPDSEYMALIYALLSNLTYKLAQIIKPEEGRFSQANKDSARGMLRSLNQYEPLRKTYQGNRSFAGFIAQLVLAQRSQGQPLAR